MRKHILFLGLAVVAAVALFILSNPTLSWQETKTVSYGFYGTIHISEAEHFDSRGITRGSILESVQQSDDKWSDVIAEGESVRLTFTQPLNFMNDITIRARVVSGDPRILVKEASTGATVATFYRVRSDQQDTVYLTALVGNSDTFDIFVEGGELQFDYITDPTIVSIVPTNNTQNTTNGTVAEATSAIVAGMAQVSTSCYANISAADGTTNCTSGGTTANDGFFLMNVTLPAYSDILNFTFNAKVANVAGQDKLNITLFNFTAGNNWRSISSNVTAAGNRSVTLSNFSNATWFPFNNFVSGNKLFFMVRGMGANLDRINIDYMNLTFTYKVNYTVNLTDKFSLDGSGNRAGAFAFIKQLVDSIGFGDNLGESFATTKSLSQNVRLEPNSDDRRNLPRSTNQSFGLGSGLSRQSQLRRNANESVSLDSPLSRLSNLFKTQASLLSISSTGPRLGSFSRVGNQTISLSVVAGRLARLIVSPVQATTLSAIGERAQGIVIYLVGVVERLIIQPIGYRLELLLRGPAQTINAANSVSRTGFLFKPLSQTLSITPVLRSFYGTQRVTAQTFTITTVGGRIERLLRVPANTFSFLTNVNLLNRLIRAPAQTFTITTSASRFTNLFKSLLQTFTVTPAERSTYRALRASTQTTTFATSVGKLRAVFLSTAQLLTFQDKANRFEGLARSPIDALRLTLTGRATYSGSRGASQTFSLTTPISRIAALFKPVAATENIQTSAFGTYGTRRTGIVTISFASTTTRLAFLFKSPTQAIGITSLGSRASTFFTYLVAITDRIVIQPVTRLFEALFRAPNTALSVSSSNTRIGSLYKISAGSLNLQARVVGFYGTTRASRQAFTLTAIGTRTGGLIRVPANALSLFVSQTRLVRAWRQVVQFADVSDANGRNLGIFRASAQLFSLQPSQARLYRSLRVNLLALTIRDSVVRVEGLLRAPPQVMSFSTTARGTYGGLRTPTQRISFATSAGRVSYMFRASIGYLSLATSPLKAAGLRRTAVQTFSLQLATNRVINFVKMPIAVIRITDSLQRTLGLRRTPVQTLTINAAVNRLSLLFRLPLNILSFNSVISRYTGTARITGQVIDIQGTNTRLTGLFRTPAQVISFTTIARRLGTFRYLISIVDRVFFESLPTRIGSLFRIVWNPFQLLTNIFYSNGTFVPTQETGDSVSSGGGGGGGSSSSASASARGITLTPNRLTVSLKQDEGTVKTITITNRGSTQERIAISQSGLGEYLFIENTSLVLEGGASTNIVLHFFANASIKPDLYLGNLKIKSNNEESIVLIALVVSSKGPLFDVKATIPESSSTISSGGELFTQISVYNLGELGPVDVFINYTIKNAQGEEVYHSSETIAVETQTSVARVFKIPDNLPSGDYVLYVNTIYNGAEGESLAGSAAWFKVEPAIPEKAIFLTLILLVLGALCFVQYNRVKKENEHKHIAEAPRYAINDAREAPREISIAEAYQIAEKQLPLPHAELTFVQSKLFPGHLTAKRLNSATHVDEYE